MHKTQKPMSLPLNSIINPNQVIGVILAGGQARRMGGKDKPLLPLNHTSLIQHVLSRVTPQAAQWVLNVNHHVKAYEFLNLPIQVDTVPDYAGPLAGVLAGMEWCKRQGQQSPNKVTHLVSVAADTPFLPKDLVERLITAVQLPTDLAVASYQGRTQPVCALWPLTLYPKLQEALVKHHIYKVDKFTADYVCHQVVFDDYANNPFFNINTPEDLAKAQLVLSRQSG